MSSKILMLIISTLYSIVGVVFLGWDVFFIVYLFWFENFIRICAYRFKMNAIEFIVYDDNQIISARDANNNFVEKLKSPFTTRLFFYFIYFVFIIVGLGLVFPFVIADKDASLKALISFFSIVTFKHVDFNIALLLCIVNEIVSYYKDFKINKIGTKDYPFTVPRLMEREDFILHLSIIFTGFFAFVVVHPFFIGVQDYFTVATLMFIPAILLISLKFLAQVYDIIKNKNKEHEKPHFLSKSEEKFNSIGDIK